MNVQTIAAEYVAAFQKIMILSLRKEGVITYKEVSGIHANLPRFLEIPEELRDEIVEIRDRRYDIR